MDTPEPAQGSSSPLYGDRAAGINRRALIGCGVLLPIAARASIFVSSSGVKALEWTALGELPTERGINRLILQTRVEPFVRAQTRRWFEAEGPDSARTLIVEPEGAWVEYQGTRKPLPDRQAAHERAQYGLYGYLLKLQAMPKPGVAQMIRRPGFPLIMFHFEPGQPPKDAQYIVPDYASDGTLDQRITFEGAVADGGVIFPRRITISLAGAPQGQFNFRITIDDFTVIPA